MVRIRYRGPVPLFVLLLILLAGCQGKSTTTENIEKSIYKVVPERIFFPEKGLSVEIKFYKMRNGYSEEITNFSLRSEDPEIASVKGHKVFSRGSGETFLDLTWKNYSRKIPVEVKEGLLLKKVFIKPKKLVIRDWETYSFEATGIDDDGTIFYGLVGTFSVEDPLIADIYSSGAIKIGVENGVEKVLFYCCGAKADAEISVELPYKPPYGGKVIFYSIGISGGYGEKYLPGNVLGPPRGGSTPQSSPEQLLSLGNGGSITLEFADYVTDGPGVDFIVFENPVKSDSSVFTEAAFVEVSQDGKNFVRFPSIFNADGEGGTGNPANYINLAGVHPVYANPPTISATNPAVAGGDQFDLKDVGLKWIRYVRIIDTGYNSVDSRGNLIDDAGNHFACAPDKCGFDLDAISIVHRGHMVPPE